MVYTKRKNKKTFLILIFAAVLGLGFLVSTNEAQAADKLRVVAEPYRISHPAYRAGAVWYSVRNPWNRDYTRIMMYENTSFTHPDYNKTGRGVVWGFISNLKSWTTLEQYESAAIPLPDYYYITLPQSIDWSVFSGEENIIYATYNYWGSCSLQKINVDTNAVETIVSLGNCTGTYPRILGWTTDNHLIIDANNDHSAGSGGWEVDVQAKTKISFTKPSQCSAEGHRWPQLGTGHGHRSPDKIISGGYGAGISLAGFTANNYAGGNCSTFVQDDEAWPLYNNEGRGIDHLSWTYSNNWFVGSDVGLYTIQRNSSPHLNDARIYQVFYDRQTGDTAYNLLVSMSTAGMWYKSSTATLNNWHAQPMPSLRKDGNQLFFTSTNGFYSRDDYLYNGSSPWATEGFFLADLAPTDTNQVDINSDSHVNIKDIQACIKVIINSQTDQNIIAKCKALAPPNITANIKDIQVIIREIINP